MALLNPQLVLRNFALGAGGWNSFKEYPRQFADINGDGKADLIGFAYDGVYTALSKGDGTFSNPQFALREFGFGSVAGGWSPVIEHQVSGVIAKDVLVQRYPRQVADVNGDGRADIIGFGYSGVVTALSKGDGTFSNPQLAIREFGFGSVAGGWSSFHKYPRHVADINGDGKADLIAFGKYGVQTALSKGDGTFSNPQLVLRDFGVGAGGWSSFDKYPRQVADINGDGKADIIAFGHAGVQTALSKGDGTFSNPQLVLRNFTVGAGSWNSFNEYPRHVADMNGDGKADLIGFAYDGVYTALSKGDGTFSDPQLVLREFTWGAGSWSSFDEYPRQVADINGDGKADIIGFAYDGVRTALSY